MSLSDTERLKREILLRSMFPTMPASAHARFIELLTDVEIGVGQVLFEAGEAPDHFLFLVEGRVVMEREGFRPWQFVPLAVVGVIDAVLDRPRTRNCRALEPSRLMALRTSDWFDMLEDNSQIARAAIRNFSTQLHGSWRVLAPRVSRVSDPPPGPVPVGLDVYDRILALRRAPFLRSAGMQAIASLATVAEGVPLRRGQLLFERGQPQEYLYVVARGNIELTAEGDFHVQHTAGDLVGGPAAMSRGLPAYAARAESDAVVLRIAEQDFYDQAEEHPGLTRGTLAFLVSELEPLLELEGSVARASEVPVATITQGE